MYVVQCAPPSLPPNTMVLTTLTTTVPPRTTITIGCVGGYYTDREEILTCGSDGQWRGNIIQCIHTGMNYTIYWITQHQESWLLNCIIDLLTFCGDQLRVVVDLTRDQIYNPLKGHHCQGQ